MGCNLSLLFCPDVSVSDLHNEKTTLLLAKNIATATFSTEYVLGPQIGEGAFSIVCKAKNLVSGKDFAVKCLDLQQICPKELADIQREVSILKQLDHPHVIKCILIAPPRERLTY
jgi:serine/threonine protein kinase